MLEHQLVERPHRSDQHEDPVADTNRLRVSPTRTPHRSRHAQPRRTHPGAPQTMTHGTSRRAHLLRDARRPETNPAQMGDAGRMSSAICQTERANGGSLAHRRRRIAAADGGQRPRPPPGRRRRPVADGRRLRRRRVRARGRRRRRPDPAVPHRPRVVVVRGASDGSPPTSSRRWSATWPTRWRRPSWCWSAAAGGCRSRSPTRSSRPAATSSTRRRRARPKDRQAWVAEQAGEAGVRLDPAAACGVADRLGEDAGRLTGSSPRWRRPTARPAADAGRGRAVPRRGRRRAAVGPHRRDRRRRDDQGTRRCWAG